MKIELHGYGGAGLFPADGAIGRFRVLHAWHESESTVIWEVEFVPDEPLPASVISGDPHGE